MERFAMKHEHEWKIDWEEENAYCPWPCGEQIYYWDIETRINAVEYLSAESARKFSIYIGETLPIDYPDLHLLAQMLIYYADELDGG
jgi:hypothetical protein